MNKCNNKKCKFYVNQICIHPILEHNEIGICISVRYKL